MHKHVNPYESEKELPLLFQHKFNILLRAILDWIISKFDICCSEWRLHHHLRENHDLHEDSPQ